ncbi:hypothetical protein C1646_776054 [Rhizophagus diaphanus]|nr:hypothetical protein C1646_776054 [Rhizophagus diaphanus] [Rhizophagus sp. MUCL 43196]
MIFIVVQVNEGVKILTGPLAKEVDENDLLSTLFDSLTSEKYSHYNIQVEVKTSTGPWVLVDEGNFPNAFTRLMNSRLQLPLQKQIFQLVNSIELLLTEPWASKGYWKEVVSNVFDFTSMMKKYSNHLEYTNSNMRILHDSENPACKPSTNCNIILIPKCNKNIDSLYFQLNFELLNRELFDFVDLNQYHNNTVVNERQTDTVLYIPYAISIRELRDKIITRLNTKYQGPPLPDDIAIPSE